MESSVLGELAVVQLMLDVMHPSVLIVSRFIWGCNYLILCHVGVFFVKVLSKKSNTVAS
jgi:hypothetical protein